MNTDPSRCLRRTLSTALGCLAMAGLLSGCGGGDNDGVFVSGISAVNAAYSRTMTVLVSGSGLSKGVSVRVEGGCGEVTEAAGGDNQTRRFQCKVTQLGPLTARVYNTAGLELARVQAVVPEPEVTLNVAGLGTTTQSIVMRLNLQQAPLSVDNFLAYVNAGFYTGVIFHRVVKDFVIQAGGFTAGPRAKAATNPPIKLESGNGLSNLRGTVAMARTSDPDSATSQFYINTVDNKQLDRSDSDPGYAVFGTVITGLDVVDQIQAVPVAANAIAGASLPVSNITIISAIQTK